MPSIPSPSAVIKCTDIASCFQQIYNFLFALLIAFAFLNFLYGAFLYLLSGGGIYQKDEGRKKMINSILAVIIALTIPIILNMINPEIFRAELRIPKIKVERPVYVDLGVVEGSEKDLDTSKPGINLQPPTGGKQLGSVNTICTQTPTKCDWKEIFKDTPLTNISFANNDNGTEYLHPALKDMILEMDKKLKNAGIEIIITDGFSQGDHASPCHTAYGTCIDVVVAGKPPSDSSWDRVIEIARSVGFWVLDERRIKGSEFWNGAHLHLEAR